MRKPIYKVVDEHRRSWPGSITKIKYPLKTEVETLPKTMGIFAFKRKIDAENYMKKYSGKYKKMIIRLLPLTPVRTIYACPSIRTYDTIKILPDYILKDRRFHHSDAGHERFIYADRTIYIIWPTPPGTVVCDKVFVET